MRFNSVQMQQDHSVCAQLIDRSSHQIAQEIRWCTMICKTAGRYTLNLYSRFYEVDRQWSFSYVCGSAVYAQTRVREKQRSFVHVDLLVCIDPKLNVRQKKMFPFWLMRLGEPPFVCSKTKSLLIHIVCILLPQNSTAMVSTS